MWPKSIADLSWDQITQLFNEMFDFQRHIDIVLNSYTFSL